MSITDELREWFKDLFFMANGWQEIHDIADRIDAEHERQLEVLYRDMSDAEYFKLPKDADGEPIHIGDVMENIVCPPVHREVMGVGVECFYGWDDGNGRYSQFDANCYRHHRAPTVEDLLFSYGQSCICISNEAETDAAKQTMLAKLREEYAAKFRLSDANAK